VTFDVRLLSTADAAALQVLLESVPDYTMRVSGREPGSSDALHELTARPPGVPVERKLGLGLWDGDSLVGFADLLIGCPREHVAWIGLLITHGGRHGRGLGRALHHEVVRVARGTPGIDAIGLGIVATNAAAAEPFWTALGYRPTGATKPYEDGTVTSSVAVWELELA